VRHRCGASTRATERLQQAKRWQLQITRKGHRPHLTIRLEPNQEITNQKLFTEEIIRKIKEIDVIKTGLDNKILAEPSAVVEALLERGKQATNAGSVIFEGE
jgi:hypothetical protein